MEKTASFPTRLNSPGGGQRQTSSRSGSSRKGSSSSRSSRSSSRPAGKGSKGKGKSQKPCWFHSTGSCRLGSNCPFKHDGEPGPIAVPATSKGNSSNGGSASGKDEKKKKHKKRKKSKKMPRRPRTGVNAMSFVRAALIAFATLLPRPTAAFCFPGFLASPRDENLGGTMSSTYAVGGEPFDTLSYGP